MRMELLTKTREEVRKEIDSDPETNMAHEAFNALKDMMGHSVHPDGDERQAAQSARDARVVERMWRIFADEGDLYMMRLDQPKKYAAFHVGITLLTWALRPDDFMERLEQAALPVAVDNDLADALLTILGVAFDETMEEV